MPDRPLRSSTQSEPWWMREENPRQGFGRSPTRPIWTRDDRAFRDRPGGGFAGRGPKGYRRSDEDISDEINGRLTTHPDVDATDIEVHVEHGVATLTGSVDDRHQKRVAELIAEDVAGVNDVTDRIRVRHGIWSYVRGDHADEHTS